jgi:hypothetical protein
MHPEGKQMPMVSESYEWRSTGQHWPFPPSWPIEINLTYKPKGGQTGDHVWP